MLHPNTDDDGMTMMMFDLVLLLLLVHTSHSMWQGLPR